MLLFTLHVSHLLVSSGCSLAHHVARCVKVDDHVRPARRVEKRVRRTIIGDTTVEHVDSLGVFDPRWTRARRGVEERLGEERAVSATKPPARTRTRTLKTYVDVHYARSLCLTRGD